MLGLWLNILPARSATITAASTARADVSAAISASSQGDTVIIPAGTSTWSSSLSVTKGITITGAGTNNTRLINGTSAGQGLESPIFDINLSVDSPIRINGIYFQDSGLNDDSDGIRVERGSVHETKVRIDHCTFEGFSFAVKISGGFGVCHECYFLNNDVAARISGYTTSSQLTGFSLPFAWNSQNYFVFEDCTFALTGWTRDTYMMDTEFPANYMVRHCNFQINRASAVVVDGFDMHGNGGSSVDTLGIVIYKNTFNYTGNNTVNPCRLVDIRGGVGSLVYSNTATGVNIESTFRDDPYQLPLMSNTYVWANTGNGGSPMSLGADDGVILGVNFVTSKPLNFAQLTYPHPLRGPVVPSTNPVIALSPGNYDFGSVEVGSSKDTTFTVRNVGAATLTGNVSVPAPFSIVGSSSYSLVSNASQVVTVRYLPTLARNDSQMVTFTGGGGATAAVNGSAWVVLPGLSFESTSGSITAPFAVNADQTISQSVVTTDPATGGRAMYTFNITSAGDYSVSANVNAPNGEADSVFVNIDAEPNSTGMIWDIPQYSGITNRMATWRATGGVTPQVWSLGTGTHQLIVRGREADMKLGRITISPSGQVTPPAPATNLRVISSN